MAEEKFVSGYLNREKRTLQEVQIIAIYNRLDEAANHIMRAHNTAEPDKIYESIKRAIDYLEKGREMAIDCDR